MVHHVRCRACQSIQSRVPCPSASLCSCPPPTHAPDITKRLARGAIGAGAAGDAGGARPPSLPGSASGAAGGAASGGGAGPGGAPAPPLSASQLTGPGSAAQKTKATLQPRFSAVASRINLGPLSEVAVARKLGARGGAPQAVASSIRKIAQQSGTKNTRHTGRDDRATSEQVLDPRTRMILFKLLNSDFISAIFGCVSTGKEVRVCACAWSACCWLFFVFLLVLVFLFLTCIRHAGLVAGQRVPRCATIR